MNLEQVLNDDKTFADGIEIVINGEKTSLGDLRGLSRAKQQKLSDQLADTERKRQEVLTLAEQAAGLKDQLEKQLATARQAPPPPSSDDWANDPFWNPARKAIEGVLSTVKAMEATQAQLTSAMQKSAAIWAEDRWHGQFDRAKDRLKGDKFKDWTYEKVRDYAATNKITDNYGLPSVERAIVELTKEDDMEQRLAAAREEGRREGIQRGRLTTMSTPTSASGPKQPDKSVVKDKGLEGLGDDVAADPELMKMLSELGAVDPADFNGPVA